MTTPGTVVLGRRKYAVGLVWQPSPTGRVAQAAREAAKENLESGVTYDCFAARPGTKAGRVPQFALGQSALGHRQGMPSLAVSLANLLPGSWAGAFKIKEGFAIVVVRDDLIAPDGDALIAEESQARERLMYELNLGGMQRVYAPENWMIPGADGIPLPLLLQSRADGLLRPTEISKKSLILGGIGIAILLALAIIGLQYQQEQERKAAELQAQQEAIERAREAALKGLPGQFRPDLYPPPPRVWEKAPLASVYFEGCQRALSQVPAAVLGWKSVEMKCAGNGLSVRFGRDGKQAATILEGMRIEASQLAATLGVAITDLPARGGEQLLATEEISKILLARGWDVQLSMLPDDPQPLPAGRTDLPPAPPPPWQKRKVVVTLPASPWAYGGLFTEIPGLVVDSLTWVGRNWKLEGVIYENRATLPRG